MNDSSLPIQQIDISNFNYELPDELIARHPLARRDECRLLVAIPGVDSAQTDALARVLPDKARIEHRRFDDIVSLLPDNTLLVRNNTKVINARLHFRKETGASIEIFLLDPLSPADYALNFQQTHRCSWKCLVGNLKKWKEGALIAKVTLPDGREVTVSAERGGELPGRAHEIIFTWEPEVPFGEIISAFGNIPIPPYLNRESEESDLTDYQTVYAEAQGSVAAPTAGLHFTDELFSRLRKSGRDIGVADVTLHVGAGTFRPVKSDTLGGHDMHSETFTVSRALIEELIEAVDSDRIVSAVGTTTVRTLESLPYIGLKLARRHADPKANPDAPLHVDQWEPYRYSGDNGFSTVDTLHAILTEMNLRNTDSLTASTSILIGPGFRWQIVEAMVTNFHQPESTLLLLVASFLGMLPEEQADPQALWRRIYNEAVKEKYRFLSYGDACLFFRHSSDTLHTLYLPGSKSVSNRALILNALSDPKAKLENLSMSSDTSALSLFVSELQKYAKRGEHVDFPIGEGATSLRFAAALAAVTPGADITLHPSRRLVERLRATEPKLFAGTPIEIRPHGKHGAYHVLGREFTQVDTPIEVDAVRIAHTSQELTALLLVSSVLPPMHITGLDQIPSLPYALMTYLMTRSFGSHIELEWDASPVPTAINTFPCELRAPETYFIEPDWSALLNFYAFGVALRCGLDETLMLSTPGCPAADVSLQPDSRQSPLFDKILQLAAYPVEERRKNKLDRGFYFAPDSLPPFVAACLCAQVPFIARGLNYLGVKESDRLAALKEEFGKLGWTLTKRHGKEDTTLSYKGSPRGEHEENPILDSHNDHRIAMALAATLPVTRRFRLLNPYCVAKSMPTFWDELEALGVSFVYDDITDRAQLEYPD